MHKHVATDDELALELATFAAIDAERGVAVSESQASSTAPVSPMPEPCGFHLSDSGNAEFFAAMFGHHLRFNFRQQRWLVRHDHLWKPDVDGEVQRRAKAAMRQRLRDATAIADDVRRASATKWAMGSESKSRLDALLVLARAEHPIADAGDGYDADPWLLAAPNGVVDLRNGRLRGGRPDDRLTMSAAVPFVSDATCPRFRLFLDEVFNGDSALIEFVHKAIGYSLTGITTEQCLFLAYGTGANGKSTFLQAVMCTLGDYALNTPFSTFELRQRAGIPNDLAALVNRRFVMASETNDGTLLNEARVKALTGCDPMSARFLHAEFFQFQPVAKFWLSVNHKPVVRDDSHGFWRRLRLIPFMRSFQVNPELTDHLRAEAPGILTWAVQGCLAWQQHGLIPPAAVLEATSKYERDSDPLADFLEEACDCHADAVTGANDLFEHYQQWAQRRRLSDREQLTSTAFGRKVSERFAAKHTRAGKLYLRIARRMR
jgi:putative DNA primase/helicase